MNKVTKKYKLFQLFVIFLAFFTLFFNININFCCSSKITFAQQQYYYTTNVEHLFTHCLIAYPQIAKAKNNDMSKHYFADCITSKEFEKILISLHKNNYCLVNLYDCFEENNGIVNKKKVKVPYGKKPLILSFDDVNYDSKKIGKGMVDKIIVENDELFTTAQINGQAHKSNNLEFVCILENFIKKKPAFSPFGDKGTLNLTGYDGVLGYRTSHTNKKDRDEQISKAKNVVDALKDKGWQFACHSYGHYHMNKINDDKFAQELLLWQKEVEPIIGKTTAYVYPFGEWQVFDKNGICTKHKMLEDAGFKLFLGVGMRTFFNYLPNQTHKVLFMDRKCVDGTTLTKKHKELLPFFEPGYVIDKIRFN